jgi:hypothetical protein
MFKKPPAVKTNLKFCDLDGSLLILNNQSHLPYRRCLSFHAAIAMDLAEAKGWIPADAFPISPTAWSDMATEKVEGIYEWMKDMERENIPSETAIHAEK